MAIFVCNEELRRADLVGNAWVMRKWVFDCKNGHVDFEK